MRGQALAEPFLKLALIHGDGAAVIRVIVELRGDAEPMRTFRCVERHDIAFPQMKTKCKTLRHKNFTALPGESQNGFGIARSFQGNTAVLHLHLKVAGA